MNTELAYAHVKEVVSGNTFVLCGTPSGGPPWEKKLSLSSVQCPLLTSYQLCCTSEEEPYAWQAREYARKKLIGKTIEYEVEFVEDEQEFGWIKFEGNSFSHDLVKNGLAVVLPRNDKTSAFDYDDLTKLQSEAKDRKVGMWTAAEFVTSTRKHLINANNDADASRRFFLQYNNKRIPAIVERVHHGGCMDLLFTNDMLFATIILTGIQCSAPSNNEKNPIALEAKFFAEIRLLNREVEVRLEAYSNTGCLHGTVYHPLGNITYLLLSFGFAKVDDAYANKTEVPSKLYDCMTEASQKHLRIWKQANATIKVPANSKEYSALVYEIVNGDCYVLLLPDGSTHRVFLASVMCPRGASRQKEAELWASEALETARKELIGRRVKVIKEYTRNSMSKSAKTFQSRVNDLDELNFVRIETTNGNLLRNISEVLVSKGLAKVISARNIDPRASNYESLVQLEKKAIEEKVGMHSQADPASKRRINDLSENVKAQYVKFFLQELILASPLEGIIRYVIGPSCFKIYIPKKELIIPFAIDKIRSVRLSRYPENTSDARGYYQLGGNALHFAKRTLMQRDVTIEVLTCSNSGLFVGNLLYRKRMNFAEDLLRLGFARLIDSPSFAVKDTALLKAAEKEAQNQSKGLWKLEGLGDAANDTEEVVINEVLEPVTITHMDSFLDFYLQKSTSNEIVQIVKELDSVGSKTADLVIQSHPLKRNEMVIAKFSVDGNWYRAKIQNWNSAEQSYEVLYGDYGNIEQVQKDLVAFCPPSLISIPWQAIQCSLAGLLPSEDYVEAASRFLFDCSAQTTLKCLIETRYNDLNMVVLHCHLKNGCTKSINEEIVAVGYARYDRKKNYLSIADGLSNAEEVARKNHLNLWKYGDVFYEENDYEL